MGLVAFAVAPALAQYPDKPIKVIVAYPPGGGVDTVARVVSIALAEQLKQPVIVENRPGASGMIGTEFVAKAPPDGYTLQVASADTHSVNPHLQPKIRYDARADFAPIGAIGYQQLGLIVTPSLPVTTIAQFIALAKERPGKLTYASYGVGSVNHIAMEMLKAEAKIDLLHVPYQGASPALAAVIGGQIDAMMTSMTVAGANAQAGKVRWLGAATPGRIAGTVTDTTTVEADVPLIGRVWYGLFGPAGLPPEIVAQLNRALAAVLVTPQVRETLTKTGIEVAKPGSAQTFAAMLASEYERWGKTIRDANIKVE
jgi:tripartite-type tricarboxylate transporter receptor subunit TctC